MNDQFVPEPSWLTRSFWENANRSVLSRQHCTHCGYDMFPAQFACRQCLSTELEWQPSTGRGRLYSFSVLYMGDDGKPLPSPVVLADVDLEEGWHMMTHLIDCPIDQVECDMDVVLSWRRLSDSINLPVFRPA